MLKILEDNKEQYTFVINIIKNAIQINSDNQANKANMPSDSQLQITGIMFNEKYTDIVSICDEELDLFSSFGLTAMTSKMNVNDDVKFIV